MNPWIAVVAVAAAEQGRLSVVITVGTPSQISHDRASEPRPCIDDDGTRRIAIMMGGVKQQRAREDQPQRQRSECDRPPARENRREYTREERRADQAVRRREIQLALLA